MKVWECRMYCAGLIVAVSLAPGGAAAQVQLLHEFPASLRDGSVSGTNSAPLLIDSTGALYGATASGGTAGDGIIFKLTPPAPGKTAWTETILHTFHGTDGAVPTGGLIMDRNGALYGVAYNGGGSGPFAGGTVFKLAPPGSGQKAWQLQTLQRFSEKKSKFGTFPWGGLTLDTSGALYGTNFSGVVFKLSPPLPGAGAWLMTRLANLREPSMGTLTFGPGGTIFGTVVTGAPGGYTGPGWIFELLPVGKSWTVLPINTLPEGGDSIESGVTLDASGVLYGTAGGTGGDMDCGIVYALTPPTSGKRWSETVIHTFSGPDGCHPAANLVADASGALYGTTVFGGTAGGGVVFRLAQQGGVWTESVIANLDSKTGAEPQAAVAFDSAGNLYGITTVEGPRGNADTGGTVFEISAAAIAQRVAASRQ